jgi:hypothetical protein
MVKTGYTFGGAVLLPEGSLVELSEAEAAGFLDKLELVEGGEDEPGQPGQPEQPEQTGDVLTVSVPHAPTGHEAQETGKGKRKG